MALFISVVLTLALVSATVLIHYEALRGTQVLVSHLTIPARTQILVVIGGLFVAHGVEICLYAVVFYLMHHHFGLGGLSGETSGDLLDYFYFSATSYTTLGVGVLFPNGPLRVTSGIEALNGFILIGWSASFTYLTMEQSWDRQSPEVR